jgi:O-antigen ligase
VEAAVERPSLVVPVAQSRISRLSVYGCAFLVAAGVVPLGSVHDWALLPLMGCVAAFGIVLLASQPNLQRMPGIWIFAPIPAAMLLQVLPLPKEILALTGNGLEEFLRRYDLSFAANTRAFRSLSIAPELTLRAVTIGVVLLLLVGGCSVQLSRCVRLCRGIAAAVTVVALSIALFALVQKATFNGKIYWFWESQIGVPHNYYGPFVNRNHFAGWMMLASAVTAGLMIGQIQASGRRVKAGWRNRVLWLSSREASQLLLTCAVLLVMLVSIMWSLSRSGMAATGLVIGILGFAALRRLGSTSRKLVAAGAMLLVLLAAVTWRGTDTLADWYGRTQTFQWRVDLWRDTLPALRDFWLVGSGINTYGTLMLLYPQTDKTVHAMQAHNDYLQLAVEGGLLVGIPVLITVGLLARTIRRRLAQPQDEMTRWIRMGAVAGLCGMALQETVEFSLQIPGVALLFAVLLAIAIHEPAPPERPRRAPDRRHHHGDAGLTSIR